MHFPKLATEKNRWFALVFLALGLAIVIIDNSVLNVAIPYILRDLHTTFDGVQWVISGYALIIATLLITAGRLGDVWGRKKIFLLGTIFFAIGSFIASVSQNVMMLFLGEALIEAIGASMMLTSSLSLLVTEFKGKERSLAFGLWGSVAGASGTVGPLLGGYLTTYYSWRWSLRINVVVSLIAIVGSVFIREAKGEGAGKFDFLGMIFSGIGLFFLIFGFIEGQKYGWWSPNQQFILGSFTWPFHVTSIIPFAFCFAALFLVLFILTEYILEDKGQSPLFRLSLFQSRGFTLGLTTLTIVSLGQFGIFFIMPIFLQTVLGLTAFQTGLVFLWSSLSILVFGPASGFISSQIGPKWLITLGMFALAGGTFLLRQTISTSSTGLSLGPSLILFGIGIGMASAQLTNTILSAVPTRVSGEASAANSTMRQVGTSIGIAIIGVIFSSSLTNKMASNVQKDLNIPTIAKSVIVSNLKNISPESGQTISLRKVPQRIDTTVKNDINQAMVDASKNALTYAAVFTTAGALFSLLIPNTEHRETPSKEESFEQKREIEDVPERRERTSLEAED